MNKAIVMTLLTFGLVFGFSVPEVFAVEQTSQAEGAEKVEKGWDQAIKTQFGLAKAKVALLKARSEIWLHKNKEASLRFLSQAMDYVQEAYQSADKATRTRIAALRRSIDIAKKAVQDKGHETVSELSNLIEKGEAALNSAISETQAKTADLKAESSTRLALAQAKASQLKAKIALQIEHSPEKAKQALLEAEGYLAEAKESASHSAVQGITALKNETNDVIKSLTSDAEDARGKLGVLIVNTEKRLKSYGDRIKESEESALFRKRYAQLQAQAALLKARLAVQKTATYDQAQAYLDEAKIWYGRSKAQAKETGLQQIEAMEKRIDAAKASIKEKEGQARNQLSDLLIQAADIVKGEK